MDSAIKTGKDGCFPDRRVVEGIENTDTNHQDLKIMPNTKSAEKRLRQNKKRRLHNKTIKSSLKTNLRKVREAIASEQDADSVDTAFRNVVKSLDRAAAKRVIHPNAAARLKSRLSSKMKAAKASA